MGMNVKTAIDGRTVCDDLRRDLSRIRYNPDLRKMLKNIEGMLTDISKKEVICRQSRQSFILEGPLASINQSIDHLQKLILVAKLMD
jgi:hypothetical protein